ncbi:MAG: hypothetical protein ACLFQQ_15850, partial [Desulfococcaceae bacterium]
PPLMTCQPFCHGNDERAQLKGIPAPFRPQKFSDQNDQRAGINTFPASFLPLVVSMGIFILTT